MPGFRWLDVWASPIPPQRATPDEPPQRSRVVQDPNIGSTILDTRSTGATARCSSAPSPSAQPAWRTEPHRHPRADSQGAAGRGNGARPSGDDAARRPHPVLRRPGDDPVGARDELPVGGAATLGWSTPCAAGLFAGWPGVVNGFVPARGGGHRLRAVVDHRQGLGHRRRS